MISFSDMHTISHFANIFLPFGLGFFCRVHPPIFNAITHAFLLLTFFFLFAVGNRRAALQMYLTLDFFWSH